ncbi:MAG TPA: methionyl-tRNA formyltransferase [Nevskiaceae bacterium]
MKLAFAGTSRFAVPTLDALHEAGHTIAAVLTQPDRPAGRGRHPSATPVALRAESLNLPLHKFARLDAEALAFLRALAPDAIVVAAYGLLLPAAALEIPRLGCINVHASLLPRWRGAAPVARAIEAGDRETGVSIMRMDAGLDTGPVLARATWPIPVDATAGEAEDTLARTGAALLTELLSKALPAARAQPTEGSRYARKLTKTEARLDWSQAAAVLERRVRAFNPAPVAWTTLGAERIRVWRARAVPAPADDAQTPGSVLVAEREGITVATGDGALRLLELQRPGGRRLSAASLINGWPLAGRRFT